MNKLRLAVLAVAAALLGACGPAQFFITQERPYRLPHEEPQAGSNIIWSPKNKEAAEKMGQARCGGPTKVANTVHTPLQGGDSVNDEYVVCVDDGSSLSLR
jgi:hypothetical protein